MSRSMKKGPYTDEKLIEKVQRLRKTGATKPIKTWSRSSTIIPDFVGYTFAIHNGRKFITVFITENMVGHKLGEFAHTRIFKRHGSRTEVSKELT